eukprot:158359_1
MGEKLFSGIWCVSLIAVSIAIGWYQYEPFRAEFSLWTDVTKEKCYLISYDTIPCQYCCRYTKFKKVHKHYSFGVGDDLGDDDDFGDYDDFGDDDDEFAGQYTYCASYCNSGIYVYFATSSKCGTMIIQTKEEDDFFYGELASKCKYEKLKALQKEYTCYVQPCDHTGFKPTKFTFTSPSVLAKKYESMKMDIITNVLIFCGLFVPVYIIFVCLCYRL